MDVGINGFNIGAGACQLVPPFELFGPLYSIEQAIVSLLTSDSAVTAKVGGRIYPLRRPQSAITPAIVYQQISGPRGQTMTGPTGLVDARFQITSWSNTLSSADLTAAAVRSVLDGFSGTVGGRVISAIMCIDEDFMPHTKPGVEQLQKFGKRQDYRIAFDEPNMIF